MRVANEIHVGVLFFALILCISDDKNASNTIPIRFCTPPGCHDDCCIYWLRSPQQIPHLHLSPIFSLLPAIKKLIVTFPRHMTQSPHPLASVHHLLWRWIDFFEGSSQIIWAIR